jgi:hypothetical protein
MQQAGGDALTRQKEFGWPTLAPGESVRILLIHFLFMKLLT